MLYGQNEISGWNVEVASRNNLTKSISVNQASRKEPPLKDHIRSQFSAQNISLAIVIKVPARNKNVFTIRIDAHHSQSAFRLEFIYNLQYGYYIRGSLG